MYARLAEESSVFKNASIRAPGELGTAEPAGDSTAAECDWRSGVLVAFCMGLLESDAAAGKPGWHESSCSRTLPFGLGPRVSGGRAVGQSSLPGGGSGYLLGLGRRYHMPSGPWAAIAVFDDVAASAAAAFS